MNPRAAVSIAELALVCAWLGAALLFAAAVAPAAFAVLPSRTMAGLIVGRVLPTIFYSGIVVGIVMIVVEGTRGSGWGSPRSIAGFVALVACAAAQFVVAPRIERVRVAIGRPIEELAANDASRVAFGRLHALSVGWLGLAIIAFAIAGFLAIRALSQRS